MPSPELDRLVDLGLLAHEARSHEQRNRRGYEGAGEIDERLLQDVIESGGDLLRKVRLLRPPTER